MGGIISGSYGMFAAADEASAAHAANRLQYDRDTSALTTAIESAREKGAFEQGRQRVLGTQLAAKQRTAYANSGVDATQGTAAAVQADTAALNELDSQQIAINAAREVWGYREQKKQTRENRDATSANINRKAIGQGLGAFSQALGGWLSFGGK